MKKIAAALKAATISALRPPVGVLSGNAIKVEIYCTTAKVGNLGSLIFKGTHDG
jgi:hypothetical protein